MNSLIAVVWFLVNVSVLTHVFSNLVAVLVSPSKICADILAATNRGKEIASYTLGFNRNNILANVFMTILGLTSFVFWFKYVW